MRRGGDELEALLLPRPRAATALAALAGPGPEAGQAAEVSLSFTPGDLALVLGGGDAELAGRTVRGDETARTAARGLAAGRRRHWLIDVWPAREALTPARVRIEGYSSNAGMWLVRPRTGSVTLEPVRRSQVADLIERVLSAALRE